VPQFQSWVPQFQYKCPSISSGCPSFRARGAPRSVPQPGSQPTRLYPKSSSLRSEKMRAKISGPAFLHRFTGSRKLAPFSINDLFLITGRGNARLHLAHLLVTPPKTMLFCIPSPLEGLLSVVQLLRLVQNHFAMSWLQESGQLGRLARVKNIIEGPPCPSFTKNGPNSGFL